MRNYIAKNIQHLRPSGIRKYFEIAATMDDVISLSIGEPNFVTPQSIMDAGIQSMQQGRTGYTANAGMLELRTAIAAYIERLYELSYDPVSQVLVTVGVSEALFLAMKAILDPGDEVLVVEPCFVANAAAVEIAGGVPVMVRTFVEDDFQVTGAELERQIMPRTKAILISYPNNPTGATLSRERLLEIAAVADAHDLVVISDEIYERLVYGTTHINFASLPGMFDRTIVLSGMSKSFAMTGWRIGYAVAPPVIMDAMRKLHQYLIMSAPTMGQMAALHALEHECDDVEVMRQSYDERRRKIVDGFNALGLTCFEPRGAFYAFPSVAHLGMTDAEFCEHLLLEEQVALIPGSAFGESGAGFVRACYATDSDLIDIALERLARFIDRHTVSNTVSLSVPAL